MDLPQKVAAAVVAAEAGHGVVDGLGAARGAGELEVGEDVRHPLANGRHHGREPVRVGPGPAGDESVARAARQTEGQGVHRHLGRDGQGRGQQRRRDQGRAQRLDEQLRAQGHLVALGHQRLGDVAGPQPQERRPLHAQQGPAHAHAGVLFHAGPELQPGCVGREPRQPGPQPQPHEQLQSRDKGVGPGSEEKTQRPGQRLRGVAL